MPQIATKNKNSFKKSSFISQKKIRPIPDWEALKTLFVAMYVFGNPGVFAHFAFFPSFVPEPLPPSNRLPPPRSLPLAAREAAAPERGPLSIGLKVGLTKRNLCLFQACHRFNRNFKMLLIISDKYL